MVSLRLQSLTCVAKARARLVSLLRVPPVPRAVVGEVPGSDPLALGPLHAEVFLEPLIEVRHVGRSIEDRDFLFARRQLLLKNLDARLVAVLYEQPVDGPAEAD